MVTRVNLVLVSAFLLKVYYPRIPEVHLQVTAALHIPFVGLRCGWGERITNNKHTNMDTHKKSNKNTDYWPRFIMIEVINQEASVTKLSPFAIHKGIMGIAGTVKDVKKL